MQNHVRLNLNKREFLTTNPKETGSITVNVSIQPKIDLNISDQCYPSLLNWIWKLFQTAAQLGWNDVLQLMFFVISASNQKFTRVIRSVDLYGFEC